MPILDARHDLGHAIDSDPHWSESYYFNGYAPDSDSGLFARIAIRPHEPHVDGFITLWLPGGDSLRLGESRAERVPDPGTPALDTLAFERVTAMQTWRLRADGRSADGRAVNVDLIFEALTPAIGIDASGARVADAAGDAVQHSLASGHFEQAGRWQGSVTVDGVRHALNGYGSRDKSWGPRRTDGGRGMHYWRWFSMNFGVATHLGGIRVGTAAGTLERGWLWRDGAFVSLRGLEVTTELDTDGLRQRSVRLDATDKHGGRHRFTGEVLRVLPLAARGHEHMAVFEGLTRWHYDGLVGHGICEYAHQLDAQGQPVTAIA